VTDLRTDVSGSCGRRTGMTRYHLWISADMTRTSATSKPGDAVAIVLDVMPGEVLKGRVHSIGTGSPAGSRRSRDAADGENNRDWLRRAQRFPVAIETIRPSGRNCAPCGSGDRQRCWSTRASGLMNGLGTAFIHMMSMLSYVY
jgi:hypothetical protein